MRQSQFIVRRLQCLLCLLCAILRAWSKMRLQTTKSWYCCLLPQTRTLESQFSSSRIISLIICFSHGNLGPITEIPNGLWNFGMRLSILYSSQPNRLKIGSNVTDRPTTGRQNIPTKVSCDDLKTSEKLRSPSPPRRAKSVDPDAVRES
jgi:hypothetical protein